MKKPLRYLFFALIVFLIPVAGQSGQLTKVVAPVPHVFIQAKQLIGQQLAFALPALPPEEKESTENTHLFSFAILQTAIMVSIAIWWRLRLGHWGLH